MQKFNSLKLVSLYLIPLRSGASHKNLRRPNKGPWSPDDDLQGEWLAEVSIAFQGKGLILCALSRLDS